MSKYVVLANDNYTIVDYTELQADAVVVGEVVGKTDDDYRVGLLNPFAKDTLLYPLNMFSGPIVLFSELEAKECQNET